MTSTAASTFTVSGLSLKGAPSSSDVGIACNFKKVINGATFTLSLSEASLKEPASGKGVVLTAARTFDGGVKADVAYDLGKRMATASLAADRTVRGKELSLKAVYRQATDSVTLEESWKLDANSKLIGSYNFSSEETVLGYTHTAGDWTASAAYNLATSAPVASVSRKAGKDTYGVVYAAKDEVATLTWARKPFKATLKGKVGRGGVQATSAALTATHEFEL